MMKVAIPVFIVVCVSVAVAIRANNQIEASESAAVAEAAEEERRASFRPEAPGPNAAVLRKGDDNHFWADTNINGTRVRFMVDTGASMVALTRNDARRIGVDLDELDYQYEVRTAGGGTRGAFVLLDEIRVGNVEVEDVEALVLESDLQQSLLGMSFMGKLHSYEVRSSSMIIRE
ncbi:TIGR02281 family clan AA aspartic protease [Ponticaulis sp.]|uniref:retropepsin-like aspartic protease family protein n=1 Tax=Ponticaulis sp. TaxID=2020902 RepID=UPI000B74AB54|nr:TIGR02281 family clan AA aspartic protease [Ponticaulis sp.]RPG16837.1 MAG: TIGR02281 family clan AA aspartic protease [Hyphomonadaceae bacterium TMED125]HBH89257.1 TIGR02281 family clan AA aspartic protease [Hyphomonadaceae bacterium]MAJ09045.1 TIGR02281 family clan AA aspartic protease [Ponticaulis sp.]MDF1681982.1 TIGR02281 family clan AA aspartic protease [Ponticaulis sp.]HBJ93665.1 TIGR02281 family clan AA aspartic protease [Hyphomonadaceae bacterium]|tara:strand:+ start:20006 stop:20530 length:525 start_codon:yes stop_codon:yes gene_type:complete